MDSTHKTIWRLQKNVRVICLGLSFVSLNIVHCLLDFLKDKAGRSFSNTWSYSETKRKACPWLAVVQALCYLCVCESLTRRECFSRMCPGTWLVLFFWSPHCADTLAFPCGSFPTSRVSGGGRASPALLGMNVLSDRILHQLTITALTAVGMKEGKKKLEMSQNPELPCPFLYECPKMRHTRCQWTTEQKKYLDMQ